MPILENPRHEAFARELAKGKSATEAYEIDSQESRLTKPLKVSVSDLVVALRDGMFNVIDRYCFDCAAVFVQDQRADCSTIAPLLKSAPGGCLTDIG